MNKEEKLEIIMRILLANKILDEKEKSTKEFSVDLDKLIDRVGELENMVFDNDFIEGVMNQLEKNNTDIEIKEIANE